MSAGVFWMSFQGNTCPSMLHEPLVHAVNGFKF